MVATILSDAGSISLILDLVTSIIMITAFIHLYQNTKTMLATGKSIIFGYISIICYALCAINFIILSIYNLCMNGSRYDGSICIYYYTLPMYWVNGKIFLLIFFLMRLYKIFDGTAMSYSKKHIQIFCIIIFIAYLIPAIIFLFLTIFSVSNNDEISISDITEFSQCRELPNFRATKIGSILMVIAIIMNLMNDIIFCIIMLRLYLKKLIILSIMFDNNDIDGNKDETTKNAQFFQLMLKTTNLFIVSTTAGFLALLINGTDLGLYWLTIEHTINVLCIYFSFGINDKLYIRLCILERCCYRCCARLCFCCCLPSNNIGVPTASKSELIETSKTQTTSTKTNEPKTNEPKTPQPKVPPLTNANSLSVSLVENDVVKDISVGGADFITSKHSKSQLTVSIGNQQAFIE